MEFGLFVLIFIVSLLLLFSGWRTINDNREYLGAEERINRINEQLRALNLTLSALQDAETGQRGYLLTNDLRYLEPYENALREMDVHFARLVNDIGQEAAFAGHIKEVGRLKQEKLDELRETLRLHDEVGRDQAMALVMSGHGKKTMDRLRLLTGEMRDAKRTELAAIEQASARRAKKAELSAWLFGGAIVLFMLLAYVFLLRDLSERGRLKGQAGFAENNDPLTGLHNRLFFRELLSSHLKHAYREGARAALLIVDLNDFKSINAEFGFAAGNQVLIEAANRLQETARKDDIVARLRGDEFGIFVPRVNSVEELSGFAARLIDALTPSLIPDMPERYVGVSIGIAIYPEDAGRTGELLERANEAVRKARLDGRSRYRFCRDSIDTAPSRAEILTNGLHRAVERQAFMLYFQPQVDLATQRIVSVEALVRWQHPELGPVSPDEFIPLAEKTGLVLPMGVWILREACVQVQTWNRQGADCGLAVNVSAAELVRADFVQVVSDALAHSGLPARRLEIEITERALMSERAGEELQRIKQLGVCISIDDFGTGYSSLAYLSRLPIDALKIDKSFIASMSANGKDRALVRTIINIGQELGIGLIAEGVETREQAQFLREHGCGVGQGYLFHKPAPATEIGRLLQNDYHSV